MCCVCCVCCVWEEARATHGRHGLCRLLGHDECWSLTPCVLCVLTPRRRRTGSSLKDKMQDIRVGGSGWKWVGRWVGGGWGWVGGWVRGPSVHNS